MDHELASKLVQSCSSQGSRWVERQKSRAKEILATHEMIKHLNSDNVVELFNKTLRPFSRACQDYKCRDGQEDQRDGARTRQVAQPELDCVGPLDEGVDCTTVISMIDDMVALLKEEQSDDLKGSFDKTEDEAKALAREITGQGHAVHDRTPCWH